MGCTSSNAKDPAKVPISATSKSPSVEIPSKALPKQPPTITLARPASQIPPPQAPLATPVLNGTESSRQALPSSQVVPANSPPQAQVHPRPEPDADLSHTHPLLEHQIESYDPNKTIMLTIADFEGSFHLPTSLGLNKSTEELYATVVRELHHAQFLLIHQGKVLPADTTSIGAYGVQESGQVDCLSLRLRV